MKSLSRLFLSSIYIYLVFGGANLIVAELQNGEFMIGNQDHGAATSFALDSNLIYGTSGDSYSIRHVMRESQTTGTIDVYVYCTAATGTPNESAMYIYHEASDTTEDPDRPDTGGVAQYTSGNVDASGCTTAQWLKYSFTNVTSTTSQEMWFMLANTEAAPVTDNFSVQIRAALEGTIIQGGLGSHASYNNIDGWTADGTFRSMAPAVVCYNSGNCFGNPYVVQGSHAADANVRGARVTFKEDIYVYGMISITGDTNMGSIAIFNGSTPVLSTTTLGPAQRQKLNGTLFPPTLISGSIAHDYLFIPSASDTFAIIYNMGNSPPAAVVSSSSPLAYVDGVSAGDLTVSSVTTWGLGIFVSSNPAITCAGGSTTCLGVIGN
jgi:hypothetical protein